MSTTTLTQAQVAKSVANLEAIGTQLEEKDNPEWFAVAQAAAMLESIRLGLATVEAPAFAIPVTKPGRDMHREAA